MSKKDDKVQMRMNGDIKKDMYQAAFNEGLTLTSWLTRLAKVEIQNQKVRLKENFYTEDDNTGSNT